ncbi:MULTISPECIES: hypothetical protein [unclassified Streptomyces]|uniref:hypothetical protein n=1 Tax=unclassified Streptomyces TaxID=2593676 RepID=UPI0033C6AA7A
MSTTTECVESTGVVTELEELSNQPARRRRLLRDSSTAFVAGLAALFMGDRANAADCQNSPCCSLAKCNQCSYSVNKERYTCPSGYNRRTWSCVKGSNRYYCGECAKGSDCWSGPFACSIWFGPDPA